MMTLEGAVLGQARAVEHLHAMLRSRRLPHALLFVGPAGVGKGTAARGLALALSCLRDPGLGAACGECEQCVKILDGMHPDVLRIVPQGAGNVIAISEVRELAARLGYAPHEGKVRLVLLEDADRLTTEAANAFLKTLEEPPARTHFVLLTSAPERLPATIHSRCQRIRFGPLSTPVIARILEGAGVPAERAAAAAPLAGGSAGRAADLVAGDELEARRARVRALAAAARAGSVKAAVDVATELAGKKEEIGPTLDLLGLWYRDAAALAAGASPDLLAHGAADVPALVAESEGQPAAALARRAGAVLETQKALLGYANAQLALERLIVALRP